MEILNSNLTPITALETLELVRSLKASQDRIYEQFEADVADPSTPQTFSHADRQHLNPENVQSILNTFISHFESPHLPQSRQNPRRILDLLEFLRSKFGQVGGRKTGLTKAERLQICDLAPTELVEIHLIVEECESRFTDEELEEILAAVRRSLSTDRQLTTPKSTNQHTKQHHPNGVESMDYDEDLEVNLGDVDDDDALVAEAREGGVPADQELDEVPD